MTRINMTRINAVRTIAETQSVAWGKQETSWGSNTSALIFAAVLIVCSVTVGCSSSSSKDDAQPKPVTANNQIPVPPVQSQPMSMPAQPVTKPAPTKVGHKKPATVNYADKTYGVTFEYPRRYAIETGDAATELLASNPMAMNFVEPGGVALAAVELPETGFANTDFSSAFFNVSVHKSLTADQCTEFAVPQPKTMTTSATPASSTESASTTASTTAAAPSSMQSASTQPTSTQDQASSEQSTAAKSSKAPTSNEPASNSKRMLGDLELRATEAVSGEGTRQSDSKYFHVFQNGSCYEFALNVTTDASADGLVKHVDRDKVFTRLEQILATVKIDTVKIDTVKVDTAKTGSLQAPEAIAGTPAANPAQTPAQ
jgi:hypothetical protein